MESNKKMNVLVLGASGVGKSTLIKSISGIEVMTGVFKYLVKLNFELVVVAPLI